VQVAIATIWTKGRRQEILGVNVPVENYFKSTRKFSRSMFVVVIEVSESKQENELRIILV